MGRQLRRPDPPQQAVLLRQLRADLLAERIDAGAHRPDAPKRSRASSATTPPDNVDADGRPARASRAPAGLPGRAIDPFIAAQLQTVNGALGQGNVAASTTLFQNTFRFINPNVAELNIYPTGRVDYQVNQNLAIRGVLNLQWRDLARNPQYPGLAATERRLHLDLLHPLDRRRLDAASRTSSTR